MGERGSPYDLIKIVLRQQNFYLPEHELAVKVFGMSTFRDYNPKKDREAVHRIWKEIGWLEGIKKNEWTHSLMLAVL